MMNYYAEGGQAYGLKSLAQELPKYGRYGDDVVAHISSDEAKMLQSMGGSGTINPQTGLPEFFLKKVANVVRKPIQAITRGATDAVKTVQNIPGIKQVSDVATQAFKPIDQALVGLDKTVGKAIPGGWGTVASVAGSAMGLPTPLLTGLGALTGSGVMRKGGSFNLQGALIGGATAYASAKLGEYARAAAPGAGQGPELLAGGEGAVAPMGGASGAAVIPESAMPQLLNAAPPPPPSIGSQIMAGNFGDAMSQVGTNIGEAASKAYTSAGEGISSLGTKATNAFNTAVDPSTYTNAIDTAGTNLSQTGAGIKNLVTGPAGVAKTASTLSGVNPATMGGMAVFGASSLADLDAQRDFLNQQKAAGNIAQDEYDQALAEINRQRDYAQGVVNQSPFSTNPDRDVSIGETFYGRGGSEDTLYGRGNEGSTLYAMGGSVDDESGMDEARGLGLGNLSNGFMNMGSTPAFAAGGQPRFLSGGGDGMSDDIQATINGNQPARLADGEFVIPADVVSHIGNGSSKAGAKQLYSMMNKVRKARTGNPKQGKQINPRKYMPA
jgi:hypothetical protein